MLKIGTFSKLSFISIRMLRHYDGIGLLKPSATDPQTSYRYYDESQLVRAWRISSLRDMGFGLAMIGEILEKYNDERELEKYLTIRRAELLEQEEDLRRQLTLLDTALKRMRKEEYTMKYDVTLKTLPSRYVASVRDVIPEYSYEGRLWQHLMKEITQENVKQKEPCLCVSIYHDVEYKESSPDVEVQLEVVGEYKNTEHVVFKTEPPVRFASAIYTGGYDQIGMVNAAVAQWASDNGYEFNGPMFNITHVGPAQTQNPDEFVTEVCYPVAGK